jgi:serine/threonine protein kinase
LQEYHVPGPQFFRLNSEFTENLGQGGQGNVRAINQESIKRYKKANKRVSRYLELIAIKQYRPKKTDTQMQQPFEESLSDRFRAAECEVLALSPNDFRDNPNIVQLMGWGLCLDTVESPNSPCCESIQIPVLVLERGEMDLQVWLDNNMPKRTYTVDSRIEEGCMCGPLRPLGNSCGTEQLKSSLRATAQCFGFQMDPYKTLHHLFIDIGHGLRDLHTKGFTHGDLKPENILLFRHNVTGWRAKICDFGWAQGKDDEQDVNGVPKTRKIEAYTDFWTPPKAELDMDHDHESLRRCDVFVYGLLLWSCFCLGGGNPPRNPRLEDALADLNTLSGISWLPGSKKGLVKQITEALQITFKKHVERDQTPWKYLCFCKECANDTGKTPSDTSKPLGTSGAAASSSDASMIETSTEFAKYSLPRSVRTKYNDLSWWIRSTAPNTFVISEALETADGLAQLTSSGSTIPKATLSPKVPAIITVPVGTAAETLESTKSVQATLDTSADEPLKSVDSYGPENPARSIGAFQNQNQELHKFSLSVIEEPVLEEEEEDEGGIRAVTSEDIASDDHALSTELFETERRRRDTETLFPLMSEAITSLAAGTDSTELYYCARFRSRIRLEWWQSVNKAENILNRALQISPAVDISTLAWLCKGPVGQFEARNLPADFATWEMILLPRGLDESERLDRFLLLFQFGAPVEKDIIWPEDQVELPGVSILGTYLRACRSGILPTVVTEICKRFQEVGSNGAMQPCTRQYLRGLAGETSVSMVNDLDIKSGSKFCNDLKKFGFWRIGPDEGHDQQQLQRNERTALLPPPPGWNALRNAFKSEAPEIYKEKFTNSLTLTKPEISLIKLRQIEVGYLNMGKRFTCNLDLTLGMSLGINANRENFEQEVTDRFPFYDDRWFDTEWMSERNQGDVLRNLKDDFRLSSFTERIKLPRIELLGWIKAIGTPLLGLVLFALVLAVLALFLASILGVGFLLLPGEIYSIIVGIIISILIGIGPSRHIGWGICIGILGNALGMLLWLKVIDWTCPGSRPTIGRFGWFYWPHCAPCWWIWWTWRNWFSMGSC